MGARPTRPPHLLARVRRLATALLLLVLAGCGLLPDDQELLAAAQLVWTLTQAPGLEQVRARTGGRPVPLPTASGPRDRPVGRNDYLPFAPSPS
jgi:hypothetical protein